MVLIALLTWMKMMRSLHGGNLEIRGKTYTDASDYESNGGEDDADSCLWPCDAFAISWRKFVEERQDGRDVGIFVIVFTIAMCIPTASLSLAMCSHHALSTWIWFGPIWMAIDVMLLAVYYLLKYGTVLFCQMLHHMGLSQERCVVATAFTCSISYRLLRKCAKSALKTYVRCRGDRGEGDGDMRRDDEEEER
jgi:hypothetical protein